MNYYSFVLVLSLHAILVCLYIHLFTTSMHIAFFSLFLLPPRFEGIWTFHPVVNAISAIQADTAIGIYLLPTAYASDKRKHLWILPANWMGVSYTRLTALCACKAGPTFVCIGEDQSSGEICSLFGWLISSHFFILCSSINIIVYATVREL